MNSGSETQNTGKVRRGAKRRERTRAELLMAARKVFAQRGYHEASILDITAEADVGVGTFYLHFKDKDDAFNTLIDEVLHILEDKVIQEVRSHEAISLSVIVRAIFLNAYANRDLFRIALTSGSGVKSYFSVEEMIANGLTRAFERIEEHNALAVQNQHLLARMVTGIIAQSITWWFEHDEPGPEQMSEQVIHLLQHGLPAILFRDDENAEADIHHGPIQDTHP